MKERIRSFFLGKPLKDSDLVNERLNIFWGVPVFASDTISTVTYAGEEILIVLFPVLGMASYRGFLGIVAVITAFLAVLTMGYRQSIEAYPKGGGASAVAMDNLGERAGLIAGASLVIGDVLIVAVSASAAAAAIVSGFPAAAEYRGAIALLLIALLSWLHLRGTRSAAMTIGIPTYLFVLCMLIMIVVGLARWFAGDYGVALPTTSPEIVEGEPLTWLMLRAYASGCTALAGIEAVSNGVTNFKEPSYRTARGVLLAMALIVGLLFAGVSVLMSLYRIAPGSLSTTFSTLAAAVFGRGSLMFHAVQVMTVVILMLAANTAFADLPHLMAMMAEDGYLPRRMVYRGSRLNYSNGIAFLFLTSALLVLAFDADQHKLLPLFASGVFISFFLNQMGMLQYWLRRRDRGWLRYGAINTLALIATSVALCVLVLTRFLMGAWVTLLSVALLAILMHAIRGHYRKVQRELSVKTVEEAREMLNMTHSGKAILPVRSVNRSFIKTYNCAKDIGFTNIELLYIGGSEAAALSLKNQLAEIGVTEPFSYEITEYRNAEDILIRRIESEERRLAKHEHLTVLIPTLVTANPIKQYLHNETSRVLLRRLSRYRYVYIFQVPYLFD